MKDTSARVTHSLLLAVSLIFTSASAQTRPQSPERVVPPAAATTGAPRQLTSQAELDELSRNGPTIPAEFKGNEIEFRGLFKWDWAFNVVYELTQPGTVTLTVAVDGHHHIISHTYPRLTQNRISVLTAEMRHVCRIPLPRGIGGATYSIKAVTEEKPPTPGEPALIIRAIAAGPVELNSAPDDRIVSPPEDFVGLRGARLMKAAYGFTRQNYDYRTAVPLGLTTPDFAPRNIRVVGKQPAQKADYSFRIKLPFNSVKMEIKQWNAGRGRWVNVDSQNPGTGPEVDKPIRGSWNCMNGEAPSLGKHTLWVKAWRTINMDAKFSLVTSEPVAIGPSS
jgi:hypothetical protein